MISKPTPRRDDLQALIRRSIEAFNALPPEEQRKHRREQRISWVYGNLSIDNPRITREMVEKAVEEE
jgi:hypothetical protein